MLSLPNLRYLFGGNNVVNSSTILLHTYYTAFEPHTQKNLHLTFDLKCISQL